MLNAMCQSSWCRNIEVSSRYHCPSRDALDAGRTARRRPAPKSIEVVDEPVAGDQHRDEDRDVDAEQDLGDQARVGRDRAAGERARPVRGRCVSRAGPLRDAVGALEADGGADHALGADRALAARAADAGLAVRVPVAVRQARGVLRSCGLPGAWSMTVPSVLVTACGQRSAPLVLTDRAGRNRFPAGGRSDLRDPVDAGLDDDRLDDDVLTGRSVRGLVWVPAMASTTFWPAASVTSPKMVCLRVSQAVATTVMKNCEPLVPGPALAMASRYGLVEGEVGVELVLELVPGTAGAVAQRVTALDHEAADHPVEDRAVVQLVGGLLAGRRVGPLTLSPRRARRSS